MKKFTYNFFAVITLAGCTVLQVEKEASPPDSQSLQLNKTIENSIDNSTCKHTETALKCVKVVEVHDGDTIYIDLPDAPPPFRKKMPVRIAAMDAPELSSNDTCERSKAQEAKSVLELLINDAIRIDIVNVERDKYFRINGTVLADGESVADKLLKDRLAYPYFGKKKLNINWCDF